MKIRQDAWTEENDLLLAETVLRHVREGSTQLNAFEEVGDILDRTSAACGFRWNAVVRHQYDKALALSRKHRKQRQRMLGTGKKKLYQPPSLGDFESIAAGIDSMVTVEETLVSSTIPQTYEQLNEEPLSVSTPPEMDLNTVINFLKNYSGNDKALYTLRTENERLRMEVQELNRKNHELEKLTQELNQKLNKAEKSTNTIQEDYETLINIMNKARKLAMIDEEERTAPAFKMDRNGNLEKLAE